MKVVQHSLTSLTLRERPIGLWILSSLTATLGLFIFLSSESPLDWFGLFCITCADLMMFGSPVKTCQFDKPRNQIIFQQKGWLGTQVISYPIDEISEVKVELLNILGLRFYRLSLKRLSGQKFYITPIPSTDWKLQQNLANHIQNFLTKY